MDLMYDQICVRLKILLLQGYRYCVNTIMFILNVCVCVCRKYVGQVYCDSLVHDESALKYLVNTMGEVISILL